jgi:rhombotail lipoprotein
LKRIEFIKELIILPESFSHNCGWRDSYFCRTDADRKTAARFNADALLILSTHTENESYSNMLSILDLTIIGMWIVPGHHRDSYVIVEGSLIDNRNDYLYSFVRAHGEDKKVRPFVFVDWDISRKTARANALKAFGEKILKQLSDSSVNIQKSR